MNGGIPGMRPGGDRGSFTALDFRHTHSRRSLGARRALALVLVTGVFAGGAALFDRVRASARIPAFDHVVTIAMQHHGYSDVVANADAPFLNNLEVDNGVATNYFDVAAGTLANALTLTGGTSAGLDDRYAPTREGTVSGPSIVDRIDAGGRSWKAYFEGMTAPCAVTSSDGYAVQSDPFVYYRSVITDVPRCTAHVVPANQLSGDLGHLANYIWISPKARPSANSCTLASNDAWLAGIVPPLLAALAGTNYLLDIVWLSDDGGTGQVAQVMAGPSVRHGPVITRYTHNNTLRTIEDAWALAPLATEDRNTGPEADFFGHDATAAVPPGGP